MIHRSVLKSIFSLIEAASRHAMNILMGMCRCWLVVHWIMPRLAQISSVSCVAHCVAVPAVSLLQMPACVFLERALCSPMPQLAAMSKTVDRVITYSHLAWLSKFFLLVLRAMIVEENLAFIVNVRRSRSIC